MENWKPVKGFEEQYAVSDLGNVKSLAKCNPRNGLCWDERPLKQHDLKGYRVVWLRKGKDVHKKMFVHQLVAEAFLPNPDCKPFVNHKHKNRADNRAESIEWCTHAENVEHRDNYKPEAVDIADEAIDPADIPF